MLEEGLLRETGQVPSGGKGKRGALAGASISIDYASSASTYAGATAARAVTICSASQRKAEVTLNTSSFVPVDVGSIELIEKMGMIPMAARSSRHRSRSSPPAW